jgi:hypothetical protein
VRTSTPFLYWKQIHKFVTYLIPLCLSFSWFKCLRVARFSTCLHSHSLEHSCTWLWPISPFPTENLMRRHGRIRCRACSLMRTHGYVGTFITLIYTSGVPKSVLSELELQLQLRSRWILFSSTSSSEIYNNYFSHYGLGNSHLLNPLSMPLWHVLYLNRSYNNIGDDKIGKYGSDDAHCGLNTRENWVWSLKRAILSQNLLSGGS